MAGAMSGIVVLTADQVIRLAAPWGGSEQIMSTFHCHLEESSLERLAPEVDKTPFLFSIPSGETLHIHRLLFPCTEVSVVIG